MNPGLLAEMKRKCETQLRARLGGSVPASGREGGGGSGGGGKHLLPSTLTPRPQPSCWALVPGAPTPATPRGSQEGETLNLAIVERSPAKGRPGYP